jgi:succinoglycan biosynthesis transport protein ExoP
MTNRPIAPAGDVEVDVRALFKSLWRAAPYIAVLALIIAVGTFYLLSRIAPTYKSETTILIETGESDLTRPQSTAPADAATILDQEAIASQVQLIRSRDLARRVAEKLNLQARPEYDPTKNSSFLTSLLARVGLAKNPADSSVEERVLTQYYANLTVSAIEKSRVIAIDFTSTDAKFAADAANTVATEYLALQREAKRDTTADATKFLESEIADLQTKVKDAEAKVETYRSDHDLLDSGGATPTTLRDQQLADLNAELGRVRSTRAEAEAKAAQIRARVDSGATPNLTDVLNSPVIQSLVEQQVTLRAQRAQLSATLLPGHPKMRELDAQVADLDRQIIVEAKKVLDSLEAAAKLAAAREDELQRNLDQLKTEAAKSGDAEVQLRALERDANAQRQLLDTYLLRYREALSRQNGDYQPADARVISRAAVAVDPDFPKKVPLTASAVVAFLILAIAFVLVRELASGRPMRKVFFGEPVPVVPEAIPVGGHLRWADDYSVRRMMPAEPTIAPPVASEVERSLTAIATQIVSDHRRCVIVTLAEGSDAAGRPLAAVALARALARAEQRVVLVDLRGDGADSATMGEGPDLPGFTDLFAGEASFAQVIFRDRHSRAHFIPAGKKPVSAETLTGERLQTILSALDHTYDHLVIDAGDDMIAAIGASATAAVVVTEVGPADPRTMRAFDRITTTSAASILLLVVDPATVATDGPLHDRDGDPGGADPRPAGEEMPAANEAAA